MNWKHTVWETLRPIARALPANILKSLPSQGKLGYFARLGLINRDLSVSQGVASGLKFNSGAYNLDTALGSYEIPVQEVLAQYLKPGDVFYDIGANVGFFTVIGAKLVGSAGQVYAFEPEPRNAETLRHNIQINHFTQVTAIEKAVSCTTGQEKLKLADYCGGHALASVDTQIDYNNTLTVKTVSIDSFVEQAKIKPPNFVKIDVEGAEIDVLKGMIQTIHKYQPTIIYEVDDKQQNIFLDKKKAIDSLLLAQGYQIRPLAKSYLGIEWNVGHSVAVPGGRG
jgi:FkbM family methyltransferase